MAIISFLSVTAWPNLTVGITNNSVQYPSSCLLFKTRLISIGLSVPHRKHIISPLRAQQVYAIYKFVMMVYYFNYHNSVHYPSSCLLFKTQLNSIGLSVTYTEHITSPLRGQQVCAIYRFVMIVCYNYHNSGHNPSSYLLLQTQKFRSLDSVYVFR
jgi:hypothetical protein